VIFSPSRAVPHTGIFWPRWSTAPSENSVLGFTSALSVSDSSGKRNMSILLDFMMADLMRCKVEWSSGNARLLQSLDHRFAEALAETHLPFLVEMHKVVTLAQIVGMDHVAFLSFFATASWALWMVLTKGILNLGDSRIRVLSLPITKGSSGLAVSLRIRAINCSSFF
jgi:hypothetical protein